MRARTITSWILLGLPLLAYPAAARAEDRPPWLPCYDLDIRLDTTAKTVAVRERVTWTNRHKRPAKEIVFNAHSHYSVPDKDIGLLAKTVEILRMAPSESMSFDGPALQ